MQTVEDTESPRVFHIWSALSAVSAAMGRRIFLPFGYKPIHANIYVLLVGTAAARKSSAVGFATSLLREVTGVKLAPDDTGGKKQGLIAAMAGNEIEDVDDLTAQLENLMMTTDALSSLQVDLNKDGRKNVHEKDKHCIFVSASEFNTFIGHGNIEFFEFLGKMYDGEPYAYKLKKKEDELIMDEPLITMLGATTPTNIAAAFPKEAIGQGFTSRVILVYGGKKYKSIPWPEPMDPYLREELKKKFSEIYYNLSGEMKPSNDARAFYSAVYETDSKLTDGRFSYYLARRHVHLLKVAMIFAATRMSKVISLTDMENAHYLLEATEITMPDALGEYGMSPEAGAKQTIMEYITHAPVPVNADMLWSFMHRDLRRDQLSHCLLDLIEAGKIQQVPLGPDGKIHYIPKANKQKERLELMDLIQNAASTETKQ